jgi:hypothetical protein
LLVVVGIVIMIVSVVVILTMILICTVIHAASQYRRAPSKS